jgi:hypothetical protein
MAESKIDGICRFEVYSDEQPPRRLKTGYLKTEHVSNQGTLWMLLGYHLPWDQCQEVYLCESLRRLRELKAYNEDVYLIHKRVVYNEDDYRTYSKNHHVDHLDYVADKCARAYEEIFESWPKRTLIMVKKSVNSDACKPPAGRGAPARRR